MTPRLLNGPASARRAHSRTSVPVAPGIVAGNPIAMSTKICLPPDLWLIESVSGAVQTPGAARLEQRQAGTGAPAMRKRFVVSRRRR